MAGHRDLGDPNSGGLNTEVYHSILDLHDPKGIRVANTAGGGGWMTPRFFLVKLDKVAPSHLVQLFRTCFFWYKKNFLKPEVTLKNVQQDLLLWIHSVLHRFFCVWQFSTISHPYHGGHFHIGPSHDRGNHDRAVSIKKLLIPCYSWEPTLYSIKLDYSLFVGGRTQAIHPFGDDFLKSRHEHHLYEPMDRSHLPFCMLLSKGAIWVSA